MAAVVRVLSRTFPETSLRREVVKQLALFCAAGLTVSLLVASYGVDLNVAGF